MQLTETVTIINKSGKVISNGRHIVSIFKEAKAAYQDRKAAIKAERAAQSEARPGIRKTQTYAGYEDSQAYDVPGRARILEYGRGKGYTHEPRYLEQGDRRRSNDDAQSHASSRRSHGSHRPRRSRDKSAKSSRPPLTENNLRTLSEFSDMTPSQAPRAYRSPGGEAIPSRPGLVHATTAPATVDLQGGSAQVQGTDTNHAASQSVRNPDVVDMHLAYGDVPPDLASRTDLGPDTQADGESESVEGEANKEAQARTIMERIEALLDEAECVHHTATSIIDHLQRKPEAAAAVALLLAELSALLKAVGPGFLGVVKGGFPVVFALLASPQFLIGVGVAVGVTVVCFGGWKIVKHIREAKAAGARGAKAAAFEMQGGQQPAAAAMPYNPDAAGGQSAASDDALVLEEELSSIEAWRRGIAPGDDEDGDGMAGTVVESADLELITPQAARSVRDDGRSIRTARTHRSSRSHRGHHKSRRHEDGGDADDAVPRGNSRSKAAAAAAAAAADAESVAGSERSRRRSRSKTTSRTSTRAITDGGGRDGTAVDMVLRPKDEKPNMLKTLFMKKKDRDDGRDTAVSVMA